MDQFLVRLLEFRQGGCVDGTTDIAQVLAAKVAEFGDFHLGTAEGEVAGGEGAGADVFEPIGFLFFSLIGDHPGHHLHQLRNKPDQDEGRDDIEHRVENGDAVGERSHQGLLRRGIRLGEIDRDRVGEAEEPDRHTHQRQEGLEEDQSQDHAEQVEQEVRPSRSFCAHIGHRCGDVGGDRCTEVAAEHHCGGHREGYISLRHKHHCDGCCGGGTLQHQGNDGAGEHKQEDTPDAITGQGGQEGADAFVVQQDRGRLLQDGKPQEQEAEAHEEFAQVG